MVKVRSRFPIVFVSLLLLSLVSCEVKRPDNIIPESKIEDFLYDYHLAKAMGDNLSYEDNYKKAVYLNAVFKEHGITQAQFDSSMVWYTRNTLVLSKIYERLSKRMKAEQDEINHLVAMRHKRPLVTEPGDSIDVWGAQRFIRLTASELNHSYTFTIPTDTNFKDRDTLVWTANYHFVDPVMDAARSAIINMQFVFQNDSVVTRTERIVKSGERTIKLYADSLGAVKELRGFISLSKRHKTTGSLLVHDIRLVRYHCNDSLLSVRDSLKTTTVKKDSIRKTSDSVRANVKPIGNQQRVAPGELNRNRTVIQTDKSPEQVATEQRIENQRLERQRSQRNRQQRVVQPTRR